MRLIFKSPPSKYRANETPPQWFINLVQGEPLNDQHKLTLSDGTQLTLIIQANPLDEISEVWQENIAFFISFCSLTLLSFFAVNLVSK